MHLKPLFEMKNTQFSRGFRHLLFKSVPFLTDLEAVHVNEKNNLFFSLWIIFY